MRRMIQVLANSVSKKLFKNNKKDILSVFEQYHEDCSE